jgi:glutathione S-transferase
MTLITDSVSNNYQSLEVILAAEMCGQMDEMKVKVLDAKQMNSKENKARDPNSGKAIVPAIEMPNGKVLTEGSAIAKLILQKAGAKGTPFLGQNAFEQASVSQFVSKAVHSLHFPFKAVSTAIFTGKGADKAHKELPTIKSVCEEFESHLEGRKFLAGASLSQADLAVFAGMVGPMQTVLDAGFRTTVPKLDKWFDTMCEEAVVVKHCGHIKKCEVSMLL